MNLHIQIHRLKTGVFGHLLRIFFNILFVCCFVSHNSNASEEEIWQLVKDNNEEQLLGFFELATENNINLDFHDENGRTPLMYAAKENYLTIAEILLDYGANINTTNNSTDPDNNEKNWTALRYASHSEHFKMVRLLLHYKPDPNIASTYLNNTPLICSAFHGNLEIAALLLCAGASFEIVNKSKHNALEVAKSQQKAQTIDYLAAMKQFFSHKTIRKSYDGSILAWALCQAPEETIIYCINHIRRQNYSLNDFTTYFTQALFALLDTKKYTRIPLLISNMTCEERTLVEKNILTESDTYYHNAPLIIACYCRQAHMAKELKRFVKNPHFSDITFTWTELPKTAPISAKLKTTASKKRKEHPTSEKNRQQKKYRRK